MKNIFNSIAVSLLLALAFAFSANVPASGQTILSTTTLASAVTSTSATSIQLTSSAGVTATSTALFIADTASSGELVFVNTVSGSGGYVGVTRGYQTLGKARTHASGTLVFIGPPQAFGTIAPSGSCTRASTLYLPAITVGEYGQGTQISDCVGGIWVQGLGINSYGPFLTVYQPNPGAVAYTSINTNGTTLSATTMYCSEIDVQGSKYVTGLADLLGSTGGTDKHLVVLYDATGNLIANSAVAGQTAGTASTYEQIPFTSKYYLVGPAKYYACLQTNGTTATVRMLITSVQDGVTTKGITDVFGTIPATIVVPTTFTTAVGPYWQLY
jgi:hypothetical protein